MLSKPQANWKGDGRYKEPTDIEDRMLPELPQSWVWASAEAVCKSVRDGTHDTPEYVEKGVPLVTSKNLLPTGLDFENTKLISIEDHEEISKRSAVDDGDILFAMIGTVGNPVVVRTDREFSIKNVGLFKKNDKYLVPEYLKLWIESPVLNKWLTPKLKGTTQKFAPLGLLRAITVALPPYDEQRNIVGEVERRLSVVEELEKEVTANLQRAERLRHSILQQAFSGGFSVAALRSPKLFPMASG